ncbi:cation:proton antiporter [Dermabacteraceae bacterium P13101]|nr:monovalent cation/H(+) antiporter subunit G [Dermabacteraceae bacterium TAE3-ERU27]MBV7433060.1 monovalent cation/H(+) antiporter subunit G [Dermabacteraceae bacterium TAE3-ERU5]
MLIDIIISLLLIVGALATLVSAVAMFRARDGYTRINVLGVATGVGLPLIVCAAFIYHTTYDGFSWLYLARAVLTVLALIIVSSVASNVLARAAYMSGAEIDPRTSPQDLAVQPDISADRA